MNRDPHPRTSPGIGFLTAFWRGATTASLFVIAVTAVTVVAIALGALVLITPQRVQGERAALLAQTASDDYAFVTAHANALASSQREDMALVILGGSSVREAYTSPAELAQLASAGSGLSLQAAGLAAHGQRLWDALVLAESIPHDRSALVLIHVSPSLLSASVQELARLVTHPRVGRRSRLFDAEARALGLHPRARFGVHLLDNSDYYFLRLPIAAQNLFTGARPRHLSHRYLEGRRAGRNLWVQTVNLVLGRWRQYDARVDDNYGVLYRAIRTLAEQGNKRFAFVESPMNPVFLARFVEANFYRAYLTRMREFARCMGVPFWVPQDDVALTPDVFYDWSHLNAASAQARLTRDMASRISAELRRPSATNPDRRCLRSADEAVRRNSDA